MARDRRSRGVRTGFLGEEYATYWLHANLVDRRLEYPYTMRAGVRLRAVF